MRAELEALGQARNLALSSAEQAKQILDALRKARAELKRVEALGRKHSSDREHDRAVARAIRRAEAKIEAPSRPTGRRAS